MYAEVSPNAANYLQNLAFEGFADFTWVDGCQVAKLDFDLGSKDAAFTVFCPTSFAINKALAAQVNGPLA